MAGIDMKYPTIDEFAKKESIEMAIEVAIDLLSMIEFKHAECYLNTWYKGIDDDMKEALEMAIQALEQTRWIPVSERLPNLDDYTGSKVWQKKVLITGYLSFDDTKELFVSEAFAKDVICNCVHDTVVTAWMPLPVPFES